MAKPFWTFRICKQSRRLHSPEVIHNFQKKDIIAFGSAVHPRPPPIASSIGGCNFQTSLVLAPCNGDGQTRCLLARSEASWPAWASSLGPRNLTDTFTPAVSIFFGLRFGFGFGFIFSTGSPLHIFPCWAFFRFFPKMLFLFYVFRILYFGLFFRQRQENISMS